MSGWEWEKCLGQVLCVDPLLLFFCGHEMSGQTLNFLEF